MKHTKKDNIELSPKYGLNPTIPLCFWCREPKDEVAILGRLGKAGEDIEAPRNMVLDYEPCDNCRDQMMAGVTILEVSKSPTTEHQAAISDGAYPTGRWVVLREDTAEYMFKDYLETIRDEETKKLLMDSEVFEELFAENA